MNKYWNGNGKLQNTYIKLQNLMPVMGSVEPPETNKALNILRSVNCYYDLYNNGLCNKAKEFRAIFKFSGTAIVKYHYEDAILVTKLEEQMTTFIINAAIEQNIID